MTVNVYEDRGRKAKVIALTVTLDAVRERAGLSFEDYISDLEDLLRDGGFWNAAAKAAGINPPSVETRIEVIQWFKKRARLVPAGVQPLNKEEP